MPIEGLALPPTKHQLPYDTKTKNPTWVQQNAQYNMARGQEMGHSPWETPGDPEEANNEHLGEKGELLCWWG